MQRARDAGIPNVEEKNKQQLLQELQSRGAPGGRGNGGRGNGGRGNGGSRRRR
jgi:hypothetical protein